MKRSFKLTALLCCALCVSSAYAWKTVTLTKANSLGAVAEKYRPAGVRQMDMVIAIRAANPKVFSNLANFKSGVKLLIPTNVVEVRSAIKGKYPSVASTTPVASPAKPVSTNASVHTKTTTALDAKNTAKAVVAPAHVKPAATVNAKNNSKAVAANAHSVKAVAPAATNSTSRKVADTSKKADAQANTAVVAKKTATPVSTSANNVVSANSSSSVSGNKDVVVDKMPAVVSATSLDLVSGSTLKSLQATVASQTQAIQSYQAQITDLNNQLGAANQQMQSTEVNAQRPPIWSVSNLGWALWALTLLVFLQQVRKNKQLARVDVLGDESEEALSEEQEELEYEPNFKETNAKQIMESEPQVAKPKRGGGPHWEQVELDIPAVQADVEENLDPEALEGVEPEVYDDKVLAGEQQDIISALEKEQDNLDWHRALLEFYIKTNSHNGFKRHYQMMMQTGLMREGDGLWEEVRKMYLNSWIYPGFSS